LRRWQKTSGRVFEGHRGRGEGHEGRGKGCVNKRAMRRKGMERAEDTTDAMMSMKAKEEEVMLTKVMEAEDDRKSAANE
jgi:hypothetical protein